MQLAPINNNRDDDYGDGDFDEARLQPAMPCRLARRHAYMSVLPCERARTHTHTDLNMYAAIDSQIEVMNRRTNMNNVEAFITRIGFRGPLSYKYSKEPPKIV